MELFWKHFAIRILYQALDILRNSKYQSQDLLHVIDELVEVIHHLEDIDAEGG